MPNQKISELTAIVTVDTSLDVLPIVDTSANTTKKISPTALKTALALDNVNNTSDANKPVSTAQQTALDAKQATLVSATNIKTINSTSLLGSGDISISASPSGVSGAIQFSNGSAFASDATNLFWDDTNNRLGVGTNAPVAPIDVVGGFFNVIRFKSQFTASGTLFTGNTQVGMSLNTLGNGTAITLNSVGVGIKNTGDHTATATLDIKGSGSTSATTSLLVQNSAGTSLLTISDNGDLVGSTFSSILSGSTYLTRLGSTNSRLEFLNSSSSAEIAGYYRTGGTFVNLDIYGANLNLQPYGNTVNVGTQTSVASAVFNIQSTTKGFLPPRMTTTQKNAIATPAAGLVVYDTTTNKLCCYNGSTWNDLF